MRKKIMLFLCAMTAVICFGSCSRRNDNKKAETEPTTSVTAEAVTTEKEILTWTATTRATTTAKPTTVTTTTTSPFTFSKEQLCALDARELCENSGKRSGVCIAKERAYDGKKDDWSDTFTTTEYEFSIDDELQTGWSYCVEKDEEGQIKKEEFDFEKSIYCIEGTVTYEKYDRDAEAMVRLDIPQKTCAAYDHFAAYCYSVVPVQLYCDVFQFSAYPQRWSAEKYDIKEKKIENGRKIVCIASPKNTRKDKNSRNYYYEWDADTGLCLLYQVFDGRDRLLMSYEFKDIRFGDDAAAPPTQQEVKEYIINNGYKTDMLGNHEYPIILDDEIPLMPEVYRSIVGDEEYERIMSSRNEDEQ